ncbi:hypothetical protein F4809DRAFT_657886 [Biscogniauxia mediterranea]|nr:hypothetical protein F4809DRAFT_657886 [Biscogniauxia mediterranea]
MAEITSSSTLLIKREDRQLSPLASVFVPHYGTSQSTSQVNSFNPLAPVFVPRSGTPQNAFNPLAPIFVPNPNIHQSTTTPEFKLNPLASFFTPKPNTPKSDAPQSNKSQQRSTLNPLAASFTPTSPDHHHHHSNTISPNTTSPDYANRKLEKYTVNESSIDQIYAYEYLCSRGVPESLARQRVGWPVYAGDLLPALLLPRPPVEVPSLEGLSHKQKMRELGRLRGPRLDCEMARDRAEQDANEAEARRVVEEARRDLERREKQQKQHHDTATGSSSKEHVSNLKEAADAAGRLSSSSSSNSSSSSATPFLTPSRSVVGSPRYSSAFTSPGSYRVASPPAPAPAPRGKT